MKLILQAFLLCLVNSTTLISLLGMDHLLDGLAIKSPSTDPFGDPSIAYMLDPNINVFLMQFRNRTELCDYKCVSIYNLPCFLLFGCNIQIRNFILIFILPFIMLLAICICCAKRFWTFKCWLKYVAVFSGFNFFTWVVSRCK
jgi:hypothetical protein